MDLELALALQISMEDERARQEAAAKKKPEKNCPKLRVKANLQPQMVTLLWLTQNLRQIHILKIKHFCIWYV